MLYVHSVQVVAELDPDEVINLSPPVTIEGIYGVKHVNLSCFIILVYSCSCSGSISV